MPRDIVFKVFNKFGSADYMGWKLARAASRVGRSIRVVLKGSLRKLRDSMVVFVKYPKPRLARRLKRRGNLVVWHVVDWLSWENHKPNIGIFDGVMFPTTLSLEDFAHEDVPSIVLPHYCDTEIYQSVSPDIRKFSLAYVGSSVSCLLLGEVPGLTILGKGRWGEARDFSCHFSVRSESGRNAKYKPGSKVVTAAACNSNIVTTRDSSVVDCLPPDYPFLTGSSLDQVLATVQKARESFGSKMWLDGLAMMKEVRKAMDPEVVAKEMLAFLDELE